ncbi:hypothetical protein TruAng_009964 [Truncatella angustata]|nr:hypothetical protein TruAng_009964 [Truncatella angustata]
MAWRAESCIHEILPKSLKQPPMDNATYRAYFTTQLPLFKNFHVTVHEVFEDVVGKQVAVWCSSTADSVVGPYQNEYVMMLYFTDDGSKVVRVREFVDSAFSINHFGKMRVKLEEKNGVPGGDKQSPKGSL